jgi:glycosyltransferase involved in cell wall biosynthesis
MKFSVVIPIYNVEKSLRKCFDSILEQTYTDFEIIAVNDGSPDSSQTIIDDYVGRYPEKIKGYTKENGGLSDARNYGVKRADGEYIVFVDSDDYLASDMLEKLGEEIDKNEPDIIGINCHMVDSQGNIFGKMTKPVRQNISGEEAIASLVFHKECFEPAWSYIYKKSFWDENGFEYMKGIYHEDFALTPLVILKGKKISFLDYYGYYYVSNQEGITKNLNPEKIRRLAYDLLKGYDYLVSEYKKIELKDEYCGRLFMHYISSSVIVKLEGLNEKELKNEYRKELKKRRIADNIMSDTLKRKIRKTFIKLKNRL